MKRKIIAGNLPFQKLIENSSSGITLLDADFLVLYRSPSAERINGWKSEERSKYSMEVVIHPDDKEWVLDLMRQVAHHAGSTETCTFRSKYFDGHYIWLQCSFTNMLTDPDVGAIVCNFVDVTAQKLTEIELTAQTNQIAELLATMTDAFMTLDEDLRYTFANGQALKMFRKNMEELIGKHIWDVFPDAVGSATWRAVETCFKEKKYICNEDFYAPLQLWQENRVYPSGGGVSLFIRDITKQKKKEQHLKLLESVITNTTDAVMITEAEPFDEPDPRILYVNEAFTQMTGYMAEEVIGKSPRILQGPKTDKAELARVGKCLRQWQPSEATVINYKKNGDEFWINFVLNPVADEKGWFTHWISIERDVTERKNEELQKALLAETSLLFNAPMPLRILLDNLLQKVIAFDHFEIAEIWLAGADTNKITLGAKISRSKQMEVFYSETRQFKSFKKGESMPGAVWESGTILTWNHLDDRSDFVRSHAAKDAGIKTAYGIPLLSENVIIGVLVVGLGQEKPEASFIALFEKLSSHFGAEIRRKQVEQELHQVFSLAPDIICILGTDRYLKRVNPAMSVLLGYTEAELLARPLDAFIHPDDLAGSGARMQSFIGGEETLYFDNRYITKAGKTLWLSWAAHLNVEEGLLFCVAKDITARKLSEQLLIKSEERYSELFQLSPLPKFVFDLKSLQIMDLNEAAIIEYGYTRKEFLQLTIQQLRPPGDTPLSYKMLTALRKPLYTTKQHAITHQKKDGEKISVDIQSTPINFKGKNARIAVISDITENLNYIHAIEAQNKKLRAISWMQSHVIRAPVARIMGLVPLIEATPGLPAETLQMMGYLLQSIQELDEVIHKITLKTEVIDNKSKQP
jgi:PAS domain S-box-containing protein